MGKLFLFVGLIFVVLGAVLIYAPWLLTWFGHLPGDIRIERENSLLVIPLTSMLLLSIALSVILNLLFHR